MKLQLKVRLKPSKLKTQRIRLHKMKGNSGKALVENICAYLLRGLENSVSANKMWEKFEDQCISSAKNFLGISKGPLRINKESWWWNDLP